MNYPKMIHLKSNQVLTPLAFLGEGVGIVRMIGYDEAGKVAIVKASDYRVDVGPILGTPAPQPQEQSEPQEAPAPVQTDEDFDAEFEEVTKGKGGKKK